MTAKEDKMFINYLFYIKIILDITFVSVTEKNKNEFSSSGGQEINKKNIRF